jgi:uncharacterized protein
MKRDIYIKLLEWKKAGGLKPLLLLGARQTGKTYILKEFARKEYENLVYCNFEKDPQLFEFFRQDLVPSRIIKQLSIYKKKEIIPGKDLIFFDEVQLSNEALNSLKYFNEEAAGYDIAAAGSLLGVKLSKPGSFPVGKVTMLSLYPMTFFEFLTAMGGEEYRGLLADVKKIEPFPWPFHNALKELLMSYYFVGGMPEAVSCFSSSGSFDEVRVIQDNILKSFVFDFAKHAPHADIPKLSLIWDSIPLHLSRENKKFMFSALSKSARGRDYENALRWLEDTGLINLSYAVENVKKPLEGFCDKSCFKVYCLDVGLLGAMARIAPEIIAQKNKLFDTYKGAFVENYAAQQLVNSGQKLFYWKSNSYKAEIDFLYEYPEGVYPFEIKAGINPKSKSLHAYNNRFSPSMLLRSNLLNFKRDGQILNIPLYALNYVEKYINMGFA